MSPKRSFVRRGALVDLHGAIVQGLPLLVRPGAQVRLAPLPIGQQHDRTGRRLKPLLRRLAHNLVEFEVLAVGTADREMPVCDPTPQR